MQAIQLKQYGGADQLSLGDVPTPAPKPGQVLVRVAATSLNPVDLKRASGTMRQVFPVEFPFIPGGDFSGAVESLGAGVHGFKVGEGVFGYSASGGAYAEFIAIDADKLARKPSTLNDVATASLSMVAQTASQSLAEAGLKAAQTILVLGAGGAVAASPCSWRKGSARASSPSAMPRALTGCAPMARIPSSIR